MRNDNLLKNVARVGRGSDGIATSEPLRTVRLFEGITLMIYYLKFMFVSVILLLGRS